MQRLKITLVCIDQEQRGTNYLNALVLVLVFVIVSTSFCFQQKKVLLIKKYNNGDQQIIRSTPSFGIPSYLHSTIEQPEHTNTPVRTLANCPRMGNPTKKKNEICLTRDCGCRSFRPLNPYHNVEPSNSRDSSVGRASD